MKKTYYAMVMACLFLSSCKGTGEKTIVETTYQGDTVTVAAGSPILSRISTATLAKEPFSSEFRTVGTVQAEMGHYAEVGVPFDGRITTSKVMLGSRVRAGQTLFEVSSPDFFEASKEYFQHLLNYETAKSAYERKKALQASGVVSARELEEAFAEAESARQEKAASEATFKAYGMDPSRMEPGQAMRIVAPISGEVVRCNITQGAYTKADGDVLLTIADLGNVWITAQLKERFITSVTQGSQVEIFTEAEPDTPIWGHVLNIGNLVDEQTRSVQVTVACANADLKLKHGMYVSVHFISEPADAIVIPSTALFQGEEEGYVYVVPDGAENRFVRRQVKVGEPNDDNTRIHILDGLREGERIVTDGGLYLNN